MPCGVAINMERNMRSGLSRLTRRGFVAGALAVSMAAAIGLSACSPQNTASSDASQSGESSAIVVGQTSVLGSLDPMQEGWNLTAMGVAEYVFMQDKQGNLYSNYIESTSQDSDLEWTLTVKSGMKFSDGSDVDADALAAALNEIQENNAQSNASAGKIVFTADGDTIKAVTERSTKVLESILGEWSNIVFKRDGDEVYFTGPYMVKNLDPKVSLELEPNPYYANAEKRSEVTVKAFSDPDAMKLALQESSIDLAFTITPTIAEQLEGEDGIHLNTVEAGYQYFARPNLQSGPLTDLAVRQAIDAGLNRDDYVAALKGGKAATGLFASYYSFAGEEDLAADTAKAEQILDQAGWVKGDDGIRVKDGTALELRLVTYPMRPDLGVIMQVMVSQLKDLGIKTTTTEVDNISDAMKSGDYDIAMWAQHTAPTGEPNFFLNHFFRDTGSNNLNGYSSTTTNALLDELGAMAPGAERDAKAVEIQSQLRADEAVFMLVDPQWHIAASDRLANYQPWCGDYYVINAELGID